jgi:lipoprotein-anchoring transpeptidase ErfK/SrfK
MRVRERGGAGAGWRSAVAGRRRGLAIAAGLAVTGTAALVIAACSGGGTIHSAHALKAPVSAAQLAIAPGGSSQDVNPSQGVSVSVAQGTLENVTVTKGSDPVSGQFNTARTAWHSSWTLLPSRNYTVTATAIDAKHLAVTRTSTFRTLRPRHTFLTHIAEGYHQVYGVGMPVMLTFSHPVRSQYRAAVERAIQLWTSKPVVGAWYWDDSMAPAGTTLVFRPRTYWPQHTRVTLQAHFAGLEIARGVYGKQNLSQQFTIGRSLIAVVNTASHYATIYYRHHLFGVWPMSSGSPGDDTADGTYLTIEKGNPVLMSGPGYTDFPVPYSVRFTWSGNYMHDAYWSVGEQGYSNVSHGCVNLSPEHAAIYYNLAVPGDPVTITHSPAAGTWDDGWTEWFLTWKQLLRGSATHQAVEAGPSGSGFISPSALPPALAKAPLGNSRPHNARAY